MPKQRYERREPTHDWNEIRPLLKDSAQITYEIIRPIILFGQTPKERAAQTGISPRTLYYKANLFDQAGMASLLPPEPPPPVPKLDKRSLPPPLRQAIVDLKAEYPPLSLHEIASICFARFGRKPSPNTIKLILATGPKPSRVTRRYKRYAEIENPVERRKAIIWLHIEGWTPSSIAGYLDVSRQTVHKILKRFTLEDFVGLHDRSSAPKSGPKVVDLKVMNEIKKLQENPELGAYRIHTALLRLGINVSPRTCGRVLALNRKLYHLKMPQKHGRPQAEMPFRAQKRHQFWSIDIRYLDMHYLPDETNVYCITILENFSRSILASAVTRRQDTEAVLALMYQAIRHYGIPLVLVSDNGSVFLSHHMRNICESLGIEKREIKKGKPYMNYIETFFNVQRRMEDWSFEKAQTWEDLLAAHEKFVLEYNFQHHAAHEKRDDGCHSPAAVLGWIKGMQPSPQMIHHVFEAICETRRLNKAGYVKFRNFLLYGERGLVGKEAVVNIFQDLLTVEHNEHPLSRYNVEWQPDDRHLLRVGNPRLYDHPFQSPQQPLWTLGEVEWYLVIRTSPPRRRKMRKGRVFVIQPPLFSELG